MDHSGQPKLALKQLDYSVIQQCMHCGFCLPTCPTYSLTGRERHSPRGRIALMRAIADDEIEISRTFGEEMYFCLGCMACMTACPAGVNYGLLFEAARADVERSKVLDRPVRSFTRSWVLGRLFTRPGLLRLVGRLIYLFQASGLQDLVRKIGLTRLLPKKLSDLEIQTPRIRNRFSHQLIQPVEEARETKYRVGLLTGCVQDLAFSNVNRDTADVLLANGCKLFCPPAQFCCGSLHSHNGELETAKYLARKNLDSFDLESLDAVITNSAGCGSHLKSYGELLADEPVYRERAHQWSLKVQDIHEWLVKIGFRSPKQLDDQERVRVTYHEACHLCHAQKISAQPREILKSIPGVELVEAIEANWCCGSAGIYNITQPETSQILLDRKLDHLIKTAASTVAVANPGCHLQLQRGLAARQKPVEVKHPITLLAAAYRREGETQDR